MKLRGIIEEDLRHYKDYTLTLIAPFCDWKCCVEAGIPTETCANHELHNTQIKEYSFEEIFDMYDENQLHSALCVAGLEPLKNVADLLLLIQQFRSKKPDDPIVIYTGYAEHEYEAESFIKCLNFFDVKNVILKVGRFVPNCKPHFDPLLGVNLCSPNQRAIKIS